MSCCDEYICLLNWHEKYTKHPKTFLNFDVSWVNTGAYFTEISSKHLINQDILLAAAWFKEKPVLLLSVDMWETCKLLSGLRKYIKTCQFNFSCIVMSEWSGYDCEKYILTDKWSICHGNIGFQLWCTRFLLIHITYTGFN